jgi:3-hydroxybutyryl-CoA dehydrogenase
MRTPFAGGRDRAGGGSWGGGPKGRRGLLPYHPLMTIERVGVIGGGLMGSGIAEVCARAGSEVIVHEIHAEAAEAARARIERSLDRAEERGKLEPAERVSILDRISISTDLADQADRQLLIEAAIEDEELKREIFSELDAIVTRDSILASNTSSIPITRLASSTTRPDHVVGLHFFNPVPVMGLVELVTTVMSSPEVEAQAQAYAESLGKTVIRAKDRAGFIVNMLLVPYMLGAIRMYEAGVATKEDIDAGMRLGANHPMGPLELSDFVGLDTMKHVADVLFEEFKEPFYASPPLLTRMVEAGLLGRKTGKGFYEYS